MRWLLFLFLIICSFRIRAQYDNSRWITGAPLLLEFNNSVLKSQPFGDNATYPAFHAHSFVFNHEFQNLVYCDGFNIFNSAGKLLDNGNNLLPKKIFDFYGGGINSPFHQQSIILPKKNQQYYVFTWGISDTNFDIGAQTNWYFYDILTYGIVDLEINSGQGKVISKLNYLLDKDSLSASQMSAVRHANGRDWWLIKPNYNNRKTSKFIITPDSIYGPINQFFNTPSTYVNGTIGQSNFSIDGSLYGIVSPSNENIIIHKFDRCSGEFTQYRTVTIPLDTIKYFDSNLGIDTFYTLPIGYGICFSPDGKLAYISGKYEVWQYDIEQDEIMNIRSDNDSLLQPCEFSTLYNGVDGRIYVGYNAGNCQTLTYIELPNLKGKNCHLCQNCYSKPSDPLHYTSTAPNQPNYSLGALKGSPCDTIGKIQSNNVIVYPNPANNVVHVFMPLPMNTNVHACLYNLLGQRVAEWSETLNSKQELELKIPHVALGMYTLKLEAANESYVVKIIIE